MKLPVTFFVLLVVLGTFGLAHAQTVPRGTIDMETFIEDLFAAQEEDVDYEDLYESLLQVHLNPISLNQAQPEELSSLYILTPLQVNSFMEYRQRVGPLLTEYELQAIPHWDLGTIKKILPFVTVASARLASQPGLWKRMKTERDAYLLIRHRRVWETRRGFMPADTLSGGRLSTRYLGDPNDLYARFRIQHAKDYSIGFTVDKDPGEVFVWDPTTKRYGFNFLSYHLTLYQKGRWKAVTLGDYQFQFGQGLVFGAGFGVGKGAETITTVRRSTLGIRPYTSALEVGFFRGGAATLQSGNWELTVMYGNNPRDARVQTQTDSLERTEEYFSSLLRSGLHRTPSEIASKAQGREQNVGGNVHYRSRNNGVQWGANTLFTNYSQRFIPNPRIYNGFDFRGNANHVHSAYFSYNHQNHFVFAETAISKSGGMGSVVGVMSSLHPEIDVSVLWRKFDRHFHSFYGNAFSEGSRPINETGLYVGVQYKPSTKIVLSAYYDSFRFPWMRFRVYAPSTGYEWFARLSFKPDRRTHLFVQVREKTKDRNLLAGEQTLPQYMLETGGKWNFVGNLDHQLNRVWSLKSRIQLSTYTFSGQKTKGNVIMQDLHASWEKVKIGGRFALFDADDFDNRQYVYEKNVLWAFSSPSYYGQGVRCYLLAQWRISPQLTIWGRWARTAYTDRDTIGTGLQEIIGNKLTETTFQLRYQFNR